MKNIYETLKITVMSWYRKQNIIFKMLHFFHKFAHLCLFLYFPVPKLRHSSGWLTSLLCSLPVQASYRQVTLFFTHTMPSPPQCISASRKIFPTPCPVFIAVLFQHSGHCSLLVFTSFYLGLTCVPITIAFILHIGLTYGPFLLGLITFL